MEYVLDAEYARKVKSLLIADWVMDNGLWIHPKRQYEGLPMMFTFEQACEAENLGTENSPEHKHRFGNFDAGFLSEPPTASCRCGAILYEDGSISGPTKWSEN